MQSQFDELADLYEGTAGRPFRKHLEIPNVLATLGDREGRDVLDFGCGNGILPWAVRFDELLTDAMLGADRTQ
ncbi:hypothetical protein LCL87_01460 [Rhodococcus hoagii]|nr:hypothetical protein [Prescottella equi]